MSEAILPRTPASRLRESIARRPAESVVRLRSDLKASVADGTAYSLMVGLGETYLPAFVLALGMGDISAGLIATIPILAGSVLQLASPWAVARIGSYRRWVVVCSLGQAASLLLLLLAGGGAHWVVFLAATLYWAAGLSTGPAWNTWIETIVPRPIRARFFANRVRSCQITLLAGFLVGGSLLQLSSGSQAALGTFCSLFVAAAAARVISAIFLGMQSEPAHVLPPESCGGLWSVVRSWRSAAGGRLLTYLLAMQAAVYLSGPFFTPYMLSKLQLSYGQYTLLVAVAYTGKLTALAFWGRFAQRAGAYRLLWIGGLGIVPLSALWLISSSLPFLVFIQFVGGVTWAAYELAMFLLFLDAIPRSQRTNLLTLYNLGNSLAMVGGGLLGALHLKLWGDSSSSYLMLFGFSSLARLAAVSFLVRVQVPARISAPTVARTLAVRPSSGSIEQPILASVVEQIAPESPPAAAYCRARC